MKFPLDKVVYSTPPSPVVLVSTINKDGRKNLAAFGFFMPCAHNPPMVAVGVRKTIHTYKYAKEIGEFVIGIPTPRIVKQVCKAGDKTDSEDEFVYCGLTPIKSELVKPFRIKECQINLECKFVGEIDTTDHTIILGKVVATDCDEKIYDENKGNFRLNLDSLYHVTGSRFITGKGEKIDLEK